MAIADIRTTPHSLAYKSTRPGASDICVFCHTPILSGNPPERAPLWQHAVGKTPIFTIYDDIGRLGLGKASVGSQSIACLSCHDANQAPSISKTSANHPFGVPYRGAIFSEKSASGSFPKLPETPALGEVDNGKPGSSQPLPDALPAGGGTNAIWARYLVEHDGFRNVSRSVIEDRTTWWVSSTGTTSRRTRNDLPLYQRHDDESGLDLPFIECSSCHDPHTSTSMFLRMPNEGSGLCLTCHVK